MAASAKPPLILGIESSCDETACALYDREAGLRAQRIRTQLDAHRPYGGVVPELASRDHLRHLLPMIAEMCEHEDVSLDDIDAVAFTSGPGLIGALLVGASIGATLAYALDVPSIEVHHLEGHLLSPMMGDPSFDFPFVALLVSGGHTMLVDVAGYREYRLLGTTLDDAAGEAFDKVAKLLGLGFPGGPEIARLAEQGDAKRYALPRPMLHKPGFDFSFSGLKTAVRDCWKRTDPSDRNPADLAASFQAAMVETLAARCRSAVEHTGYSTLIAAGGVAANRLLRAALSRLDVRVVVPPIHDCTDNAAMIAYAGALALEAGDTAPPASIRARARWPLAELAA